MIKVENKRIDTSENLVEVGADFLCVVLEYLRRLSKEEYDTDAQAIGALYQAVEVAVNIFVNNGVKFEPIEYEVKKERSDDLSIK